MGDAWSEPFTRGVRCRPDQFGGLTGRIAHDPRGQLLLKAGKCFFFVAPGFQCKCCEKHP